MENLKNHFGKGKMLSILLGVVFLCSCQKDQSSIDEYRYRRGINLRRPTSPVDSTNGTGTTTDSTQNQPNSSGSNTVSLPKVLAGNNVSVTVTSITLDGSQSTGGTSYLWTKENGPSATIASATSLKTNVTGLVTGEYRFRLTAKNSAGTASDTVHVSVDLSTTTSGGSSGTNNTGTSNSTPSTNSYTRKNLLFVSTFDDASPFSNFYSPTQSCCSYSVSASSEKAYNGSKSLRVELFKSDPFVAGSIRAEVVPQKGNDPLNAERWFGAAYFFPSTYYAYDGAPESILQWHQNSSTGSPPFMVYVMKDHIYVVKNDGSKDIYYDVIALPKDQWVSIVVHYIERSDANGLFDLYINGSKLFHYTGPASFSGVTNYLKIGLYKWPWKEGGWNQTPTVTHRIFYIDDIRYGNELATYQDVAPGNY
jgi:hypothetical protein